MSYAIEVDWAPAYELLISLNAYIGQADRKVMDLGTAWATEVRSRLSPSLTAELARASGKGKGHVPTLLVQLCPDERDAAGFLRWLRGLSAGALYECLAPHLCDEQMLEFRVLSGKMERHLDLLAAWNEEYFSTLDPAILRGLADDAAAKRALVGAMAPQELVELATSGIDYRADPEITTVLLVPQYHYRPWNLYDRYRGLKLYEYPADAVEPAPGDPPPALLRLTRALDDENRLRILRFLAAGRRSFSDVAGYIDLAKSTVHHHLVVLRASGLVRVHESDAGTASYSLRPGSVDRLGAGLQRFLSAEPAGEPDAARQTLRPIGHRPDTP